MTAFGSSSSSFVAEHAISLHCVICSNVAEDARQHERCGRLFCKECLEEYGNEKPCPHCGEEQPQYFADKKSKPIDRYHTCPGYY
jgi:late competence protein required for DNA uptake (superfamily II DNA/RNA helicase)